MLWWAVALGCYAYLLFFLGIFGVLSQLHIVVVTLVFVLVSVYIFSKSWHKKAAQELPKSTSNLFLLGLIFIQSVINLIGALGPELGFDAIWYHLSIPRIWLLEEKIFFIPGGPFDYSLLPKIIELLYLAPLSFSNEIGAKVIHWVFGLLCVWVTYKIARLVLDQTYSLLAGVIFYANLVVGWQSITAYIDLGRTFYEGVTLLTFLYFVKFKKEKWLWWTAVFLGLAVSSKILALGSAAIFCGLLFWQKRYRWLLVIGSIAVLIPAPWLLANFAATGNPIFPVFGGYDLGSTKSIFDFVTIWFQAADPISPLYLILVPLAIFPFLSVTNNSLKPIPAQNKVILKNLSVYCALSLLLWWLLPRTGGGRFLLPYLPAFSVLAAVYIERIKDLFVQKLMIGTVVFLAIISIGYRGLANAQYLPVILGRESKHAFLQKKLDFNFSENWYYLTDENLRQVYDDKPNTKPFHWTIFEDKP